MPLQVLSRLAFFAASAAALSASAPQSSRPTYIDPPSATLDEAGLEHLLSRARISVGTDRATVVAQFGYPTSAPARHIWIYRQLQASNLFHAEAYDSLVLVFSGDQVSHIKLVNSEAMRQVAARRAVAEGAAAAAPSAR